MKSKVLILDNHDSFVFNLMHYVNECGFETEIKKNDEISLEEVAEFHKIILSPGPGIPSEAGILLELIKTYHQTKSILGVCLGHQAIAEVFGGKLKNLEQVKHGLATEINVIVEEEILFKNLPRNFEVGRYHSWVVSPENFPDKLEITSFDQENEIMSLRHKTYDLRGVQFHPESILTPFGKEMIRNWLEN